MISDAMDLKAARLKEVMQDLSSEELDVLQKLLQWVREDFARLGRHDKACQLRAIGGPSAPPCYVPFPHVCDSSPDSDWSVA